MSNGQRTNTSGLRIFATSNKRRDSICNQEQIKKLDYQIHDCGAIEFFISFVYSFTMLHLYFTASVSKLKYMIRHVVYEKISRRMSDLFNSSPEGRYTRGLKMRKVEKIVFHKTEINEWAL